MSGKDQYECAYLSSDSDSEDDFNLFTILLSEESIEDDLLKLLIRQESRFFEDVITAYNESEFLRNLRICRELYHTLSEKIKSSEEYKKLLLLHSCSEEKILAVFLWFAGHEDCTFENLSHQFNFTLATVKSIIECVSKFLSNLTVDVIEWPSEDQKKETSSFFETKAGFPKVFGAIGCIRIDGSEPNFNLTNLNPKRRACVNLQAVCNEKRKFISVFVGIPGSSSSNRRVFENSYIYPILKSLCGGYRILGDSTYPCMECLLTPYKDSVQLTEAEQTYNVKLASCRNISVEESFRLLKERFRQLNDCKLTDAKQMRNFVTACCVLHNLSREEDFNCFEPNLEKDNSLAEETERKIRDHVCQQLQLPHNVIEKSLRF